MSAPGPAVSEDHVITLAKREHVVSGSIPFVFNATCICGWWSSFNAPKWTLLAVQQHWVETKLTNGRGLLPVAATAATPKREHDWALLRQREREFGIRGDDE